MLTTAIDVECFWCAPLPVAELVLRRYHRGVHNASVVIGEIDMPLNADAVIACPPRSFSIMFIHGILDGVSPQAQVTERAIVPPIDDSRWPIQCAGCDYRFTSEDSGRYTSLT